MSPILSRVNFPNKTSCEGWRKKKKEKRNFSNRSPQRKLDAADLQAFSQPFNKMSSVNASRLAKNLWHDGHLESVGQCSIQVEESNG